VAPIASGAPSGRGLQRDSEREIPMKARLWFAVLAFFLMVGCSATARLYPVQRPLMAQSPAPVFTGKFTGVLNGEVSLLCCPTVSCARAGGPEMVPVKGSQGTQSAPPPASPDMPAIWDQIYGP